jgi:hypothetical protein
MERKDPTGSRISKKVNYTSPLSAIIPCSQSQKMIFFLRPNFQKIISSRGNILTNLGLKLETC